MSVLLSEPRSSRRRPGSRGRRIHAAWRDFKRERSAEALAAYREAVAQAVAGAEEEMP